MVEKIGGKEYTTFKEGGMDVLKINATNWPYIPSIEDNATVMSRIIDNLVEVSSAGRIILSQRRNYEYDEEQTSILREIASLYNYFVKQKKLFGLNVVGGRYGNYFRQSLQYILYNLLRSDPIGAYVELKRLIREEKIKVKKTDFLEELEIRKNYLGILSNILNLLEDTKLISLVKPYLAGHVIGSRVIYRNVFRPIITPDFMFTRLMAQPPVDGEQVDFYIVGENTEVTIYRLPGKVKYVYHLNPPEFKLSEDKYELLDLARNALAEHKPRDEDFIEPEKMRTTFFNIGRDLLQELSEHKGLTLRYSEIEELARILVRYTVGFGLIEVLLRDPKIQDITVNGPIGGSNIHIVHQNFDECVTNIIPSVEEGEGWASKFRILSGRPLDNANPVLDTELVLPYARARVAIMARPLNPVGLAFAFRRHRDKPWTFPLFIQNKLMNPLAAGLLDFLIQGSRTMLIAGTRSSGKTSLLGASMLEIMRKYRVITVEDTRELSVDVMRKLGYNIQPMKVRSALMSGGSELSADEGIRTSLRMGDSSLIVGEIRSKEALALYEAMRIGALANVVAGTIHGASPYGVFDRVVNDLGVPRTSFKATDIIVVVNPIKSSDGLHKYRRIIQITEVRKHWEDDPLREKGFVDLMRYDPIKDELVPTDDLINGDSEVLKDIAANVKEWSGDWNAIWDNILLRAKIKESLVKYSQESKMPELLESDFIVKNNDMFHRISDEIRENHGKLDSKKIFLQWNRWIKNIIKQKLMH
ncbi:type II/IV secretion system ATPase subunit [archaeon]|nr:type II/IV secretion system ATPase subunit [archaeon]